MKLLARTKAPGSVHARKKTRLEITTTCSRAQSCVRKTPLARSGNRCQEKTPPARSGSQCREKTPPGRS
nr:MAG: hypothetical protein [Molluscum contagiosum virus]